jgi:hypothetical protein
MFQVAFGDPDKSDSYGRKKKRSRQRIRRMKEDVRKKEEAIDRIGKVQLRTSSPSGRLLY